MMSRQKKTEIKTKPLRLTPTVKLKNTSFQGLEIFIKDGRDFKSFWLTPGSYVEVLERDIPQISRNLIRKRMLSIVK